MTIGLITFHAAYNFGSVLQAYSTQKVLTDLGGNCTVINYRTDEQKRIYALIPTNPTDNIVRRAIKALLSLPTIGDRQKRGEEYERLFREVFNLTVECATPDDVYGLWNQFDLIVSGSDQIWNKHANELHHVGWEYIRPYFLHGYGGIKVSYASSMPNMKREELELVLDDIQQFKWISAREAQTAEWLSEITGRDVPAVLDPTLLLTKQDWLDTFRISLQGDEKYVLYYALNKRREVNESLDVVCRYAERNNLKVKFVAPLGLFRRKKNVEFLYAVSPVDFLNLIYHANVIITDSYHGTLFSINLEKNFYSINGKNVSDFRKTDVLRRLGLQNRSISSMNAILEAAGEEIDYTRVNARLTELRRHSREYLVNALQQ